MVGARTLMAPVTRASVASTRQGGSGGHRPSPRSPLGGLARGGALNLVGAGCGVLAGLGAALLATRGLAADAAGVFFTASSLFLVGVVVAKLGTPTGLVYWLAQLRARNAPWTLSSCLRVALTPVFTASLVAALGLIITAPTVARLVGASEDTAAELTTQLRLLAGFLPLAAAAEALLAATRGYGMMRPTVLVDKIGRPLAQLVGLLLAVTLAAPLTAYTLAWALPYLPATALAWLWLRRLATSSAPPAPQPHRRTVHRRWSSRRRLRRRDRRLWRSFWAFTTPRAFASVIQLLLQRLDIVLVAALLGLVEAALYTAATRFVVVGQLGNQAIGTAVEPRLATAVAKGDLTEAGVLYRTATGWLILLTWPLYLVIATAAPQYLGLFGSGYAAPEAVGVVVILCTGGLLATGCGMVDVVVAMAGRTLLNLGTISLALAVNLVVDLLLIPRYGIVGAALGWAAALAVKNLVPLVLLYRSLGLHPFGRGTVTAAALAAGCFGVPLLLLPGLAPTAPASLIAALIVCLMGYATAAWWLREPLALAAFGALRIRRRRTGERRSPTVGLRSASYRSRSPQRSGRKQNGVLHDV